MFGTVKLPVSQFQSSRGNLKLGVRLGRCNLVRSSINCEKDVALPNNVPVLEKYSSKGTTYLRAQFDLRNRRELAKEAQPCIDVLRQRLAHHDLWKCSRRSTGGTSTRPRRILESCTHKHHPCQPSGNPQLGRRSPTDSALLVFRPLVGRQFRFRQHFSSPGLLFLLSAQFRSNKSQRVFSRI